MQKLLFKEENIYWVKPESVLETYLADELPSIDNCSASHSFVFKNGAILLTDLKEGEKPTRILDIPGGHRDKNQSPEVSVVRETFEETGVHINVIKLVGYKKLIVTGQKPEDWPYTYLISYIAFYLCEVVEETPFEGNEEVHGRVWLPFSEFEKSEWCKENKIFIEEIRQIGLQVLSSVFILNL